jgi:hypothetical protein
MKKVKKISFLVLSLLFSVAAPSLVVGQDASSAPPAEAPGSGPAPTPVPTETPVPVPTVAPTPVPTSTPTIKKWECGEVQKIYIRDGFGHWDGHGFRYFKSSDRKECDHD